MTATAPSTPTNLTTTMRADEKQVAGGTADVRSLLGTWFNSTPTTDHIARVEVTERDGTVLVRPYGSADGEPVDWGTRPASPFVASGGTQVAGFHASYRLGAVRTELAANEKLGILVIQSYTSFHDDSGRPGHYAREFFHRAESGLAGDGTRPAGAAVLIGHWANSNADTGWIREFTLAERNGGYTLSVRAANEPTDWGEVEVTTYQDNIGEPAFHAAYDLGPVEAVLAANTNKGLVIIAAFLRSKSDGAHNFLCREFYYKVG